MPPTFEIHGPEDDPVGWLSVQPTLPKEQRQARGNQMRLARIKIALLIAQRCQCAHCAKLFEATWDCDLDHKMPLARGGGNEIENLQLLCQSCSARKGAKHPVVWQAGR